MKFWDKRVEKFQFIKMLFLSVWSF